ncbi:anti-sigma factor [Pontimicrobium sp. MEBiC06410]|jgi:anti-sigma-K factor RskA
MDSKTYIESGILELYVAGSLSEEENEAVYKMMQQYPEVTEEVIAIEAAIIKLTAGVAPNTSSTVIYNSVKDKLELLNSDTKDTKVIPMTSKKTNWFAYTGWAASIILGGSLLWMVNQNNTLESQIQTAEIDKDFLEIQIENSKLDLADTKKLLNVLRDKDVISVPLAGQAVYPEAYAKAYWNKKDQTVYFDLQGLPEPPEGKVYQVWSLTLNPLTPTSLGTIDNFKTDDNKIFNLENTNESQAFGITLEPAGGSESPTLEQLYTLGAIDS